LFRVGKSAALVKRSALVESFHYFGRKGVAQFPSRALKSRQSNTPYL